MKKVFENDFDKLAEEYEAHQEIRYDLDLFLKYILDNRQSDLDIGCGTGRLTAELSKQFGNVHGIDISSKMIEIAQKKRLDNVEFQKMDAEQLSFEDNSFDFIVSVNTFHHLDLSKTFNEINRVLKIGWVIVIIDLVGKPIIPICYAERIIRYLKNIFRLGLSKANKKLKFDMKFLEHIRHDNFMSKKEFKKTYEFIFKECRVSYFKIYHGHAIWKKELSAD